MFELNSAILKDKDRKTQLEVALSDMIGGVSKAWCLTPQDMAEIFRRDVNTVKGWMKPDGRVPLGTVVDLDTKAILEFLEIYNQVASFIVTTEDQKRWLKDDKSAFFDGMTPLAFLKDQPENIIKAKARVSRLTNP